MVNEDLDALAKAANSQGYPLTGPGLGHVEAAPEPGDAAISAIAEFRVGSGVFVFGSRVGAGGKAAPVVLLDGGGQCDRDSLLGVESRPSAGGGMDGKAREIGLIGKKERVVFPGRVRIRP